jgi:hypothetical protein
MAAATLRSRIVTYADGLVILCWKGQSRAGLAEEWDPSSPAKLLKKSGAPLQRATAQAALRHVPKPLEGLNSRPPSEQPNQSLRRQFVFDPVHGLSG